MAERTQSGLYFEVWSNGSTKGQEKTFKHSAHLIKDVREKLEVMGRLQAKHLPAVKAEIDQARYDVSTISEARWRASSSQEPIAYEFDIGIIVKIRMWRV